MASEYGDMLIEKCNVIDPWIINRVKIINEKAETAIIKLKSKYNLSCSYIVNCTNWNFKPKMGLLNKIINENAISLENESKKLYSTAKKKNTVYSVKIDKKDMLYKNEKVMYVLQIVAPNRNERLLDFINDENEANQQLKLCFDNIFIAFYDLTGLYFICFAFFFCFFFVFLVCVIFWGVFVVCEVEIPFFV